MSQPADLYSIIRFYANRTHSPTFPVDTFVTFLEKYAKRYAAERPDIAPWAHDTSRQVWAGITQLTESGKCSITTEERGTMLSVAQFFVDLLQQVYRSAEETPELPFPDETSLNVAIPPDQIRPINLEADFAEYLNTPQGATLPIIKLVFPEGSGAALVLSGMIPKRFLELALLKIRHYLRSHNNKDYVQHKLAPAFQGKESQLKDALNQLMVRPFDSMMEMEKAGDFSFPFWAYFTSLVKSDIRKRNDQLPEDIAALQSVFIVEVFNNYYKGKVQKERDAETAFRNLEVHLDKLPYYYSIDDIIRFTDTKGVPLLGQYSREALEEYLRTRTTSGGLDSLPELLIVHGSGDDRWFVKKSKLLPLCVKLLGEARPRIKTTLAQRWFKLMSDYCSEDAMETDEAFDQELAAMTETISPMLAAVLREKTLYLVHKELEGTEAGIPEASRLFYKETLVPMSTLYLLSRKDLLTDVRMLLPFWHSMPILSRLIAFFKHLGEGKPKKARKTIAKSVSKYVETDSQSSGDESHSTSTSASRKAELKEAARKIEKQLVPDGVTLESYLTDLQDRWNRIINPQAKANLNEDVNALIRDYLRRTARSLRAISFTPERVQALADTLSESPSLQKIPARDSLRLYIQLYMVKLVLKS